MQISSNINLNSLYAGFKTASGSKNGDSVRNAAFEMREQSFTYSFLSVELQLDAANRKFEEDYREFQTFLKEIGYRGKPIAELSPDEAAELVGDGGFFGIDRTAERIADFVLNGAGDDKELLRAGREGIMQGFREAEALWGDRLPEISYKTIEKAAEIIDKAMMRMGYTIVDTQA